MAFNWRYRAGIRVSFGDGAMPTARWFRRGRSVWQGDGVHSNPRFFKVDWRIWTPSSAIEEGLYGIGRRRAIWGSPAFCIAEAMELLQDLQSSGTLFMVITRARKRISPDAPWDAARVPEDRKAIPYDEDTDPEFFGHR
ncbi:hypothetical protein [Henriciella pelagia]|jgi:hypothetical protein|uniref:Uncharacterized protein n=1 Tax=Henriciella pelagia TaxID=1977912 RepID=A0ABQ1JRG0_9PROT|nr:hypothetical protein [Henriciella pelagia]GGB74943.1 hypothetical protein GCM10011503_24550 [Henriciella pelagia]